MHWHILDKNSRRTSQQLLEVAMLQVLQMLCIPFSATDDVSTIVEQAEVRNRSIQ